MNHPAAIAASAPPRSAHRRGIALLVVLGVVTLVALIVAMLSTAARVSNIGSRVNCDRIRLRYAAESALSQALWLGLLERDLPDPTLRPMQPRIPGETVPLEHKADGRTDEERWLPDGTVRAWQADDVALAVRLLDASRGFDLSGALPGGRLRSEFARLTTNPGEPLSDELDAFCDVLDDYADTDDLTHLKGMEKEDYARLDLSGFPRNHALQFREEAYWLPGLAALLPVAGGEADPRAGLPADLLRIIPPSRARFPGAPSFLTSSPAMVQRQVGLTDAELAVALAARERWRRDRVALPDGLGDLFPRVAGRMNLQYGRVWTIEVTARLAGTDFRRRLVATVDSRRLFVSGQLPYVTYWERVVY